MRSPGAFAGRSPGAGDAGRARACKRWLFKTPSMNVAPASGPTADRDARGNHGMDELDRLGRPGAYRLGMLRAAGAGPDRPRPCRPSFARPSRRGPLWAWVLAFAAGAAAVAGGAVVGLTFIPFLVGLGTGLVARWGGWRLRVMLPAAVVMAALGWGIPLAWQAWHAEPHGARGTTAVLLAGVLQALAGLWLGRVLAALLARHSAVQVSDAPTDRDDEARDLVRLLGDSALSEACDTVGALAAIAKPPSGRTAAGHAVAARGAFLRSQARR
jgi:hypothetical protein